LLSGGSGVRRRGEAVGKTNLYDVETNLGHRKVAAASEGAARDLVEKED